MGLSKCKLGTNIEVAVRHGIEIRWQHYTLGGAIQKMKLKTLQAASYCSWIPVKWAGKWNLYVKELVYFQSR